MSHPRGENDVQIHSFWRLEREFALVVGSAFHQLLSLSVKHLHLAVFNGFPAAELALGEDLISFGPGEYRHLVGQGSRMADSHEKHSQEESFKQPFHLIIPQP